MCLEGKREGRRLFGYAIMYKFDKGEIKLCYKSITLYMTYMFLA